MPLQICYVETYGTKSTCKEWECQVCSPVPIKPRSDQGSGTSLSLKFWINGKCVTENPMSGLGWWVAGSRCWGEFQGRSSFFLLRGGPIILICGGIGVSALTHLLQGRFLGSARMFPGNCFTLSLRRIWKHFFLPGRKTNVLGLTFALTNLGY